MSAAAPNVMPYRYRAEARFSAISCPRGTLACFCADYSTASPRLVAECQVHSLVESLPRRVSVCALGVGRPPHATFVCRESPWLGRRSSLAWGIEGQRRQVIMT